MIKPGIDDRSPTAKAMSKVSEIIALCLLMIVPALIGVWLDRNFGTVMLFTIAGLFFGMTGAVLQLIKLVAPKKSESDQSDEDSFDKFEK